MNDDDKKKLQEIRDRDRREYLKRYHKAMNSTERAAERARRKRQKYPKQAACWDRYGYALAAGKLARPDSCEECGKTCIPEGHHSDYALPLVVKWLCRQCHSNWHLHNKAINGDDEMGMLDRFEKYADKTFNDACELYLSEFEGKSRRRQEYGLAPIREYIGDLPLIDVDDQALATYKTERRKQVMPGTVNKEISTATSVLRKAAHVWRWIPSAPRLQRVKGATKKPYPLSWPEQINVFKRLVGDLQKIVLFAINTGVRREEIFKLRWADERDIDGVKLFILRDTKNGQDRPVILNSIALRVVEYMRAGQNEKGEKHPEFVFWPMTVNKVFNRAWLDAGLPDDKLVKKGVHNLRHTFGYRLRQAGVAGEDRDALLGHHNRSLTQHYAVPDIQRLAELAERVTVRNDTAVLR